MTDLSHTHRRILDAMRSHGAVTERDFDREPVIDGGEQFDRLAPRIGELRDFGYAIETQYRVTEKGKRYAAYVLGETPVAGTPAVEPVAEATLFEPPTQPTPHWKAA